MIYARVGVAYYDSSTRQLSVLEFWEDTSDYHLIDLGMNSELLILTICLSDVRYLVEERECLWTGTLIK